MSANKYKVLLNPFGKKTQQKTMNRAKTALTIDSLLVLSPLSLPSPSLLLSSAAPEEPDS